MSQPFRITEAGAIGGSGRSANSEGGRGFEIETRSEKNEADRVSISPEGKSLAEMVATSDGADKSDSKQSQSDDSPKSRFERATGAEKAKADEDSSEVEGTEEDSKEVSKEVSKGVSEKVTSDGKKTLSREEEEEVRELKRRDREVRTHEMAHKAAAGSLASGGPVYEIETGPDGGQYAVGGHVSIRIPKGRNPAETIRIAQQAKRAALAPASPSGQDRSVAVEAQSRVVKAHKKLAQDQVDRFSEAKAQPKGEEKSEEVKGNSKSSSEPSAQFDKEMEGVPASESASDVSDASDKVGLEPAIDDSSAKSKKITDAYNQISDFTDELAMAGCNSCRQFTCGCSVA